mgnify:CR=1 FL=1
MTAERHNRWWNSAELRTLRDLRSQGRTRAEIAATLDRSEASVKAQIGRFRTFTKLPQRPRCGCCGRPMP